MSLKTYAMVLSFGLSTAQAADVIVQFTKSLDQKAMSNSLSAGGFQYKEALIPELNIHLLSHNSSEKGLALQKAKALPNVKNVMNNEVLKLRDHNPNDPGFAQQWGLSKIQAPAAWDLGTGGQDANKNDVVVAIVDGGVDLSHDDLRDNIWINSGEIPGNKKDDDNNGYVDDVNGWNAYSDNATIPVATHGTHVAGIAGAHGNNGKLVSGVNWDVKIMAVAASSGETSIVLKGYGYVLAQKKRWLQSGGKEGANVVATNSSFGVDAAECMSDQYRMWNDIYEQMGKAGILSAAATANQAWDIDKTGDVPTSCTTEWLVAVTNTTKDDKLYSSAGWGLTHVDLGAPGTDVYSTVPNNRAQNLTGTSMATPHVAGSIAYLHSVASQRFVDLAKANPASAALELKRIMLESVDPLAELKGKTVSGGRLNLKKAAQVISNF